MNYIKGKIKEFYLLTSEVENIFLSEYMPAAPGDYVKVYLFGLMYASHGEAMTHNSLARNLRLTEEEVDKAWEFWADMAVIKKHPIGPGLLNYDVEFCSLREQMYGGHSDVPESEETADPYMDEAASALINPELKNVLGDIERLTGKTLAAKDAHEVYTWMQELGASAEMIIFAVDYCVGRGKNNINYISKVVTQWCKDGYKSTDEIKEHLKELDERHAIYKRILQALGLNRGVTEAEKKLIDTWIDDMHFNLERILEACGRTLSISNPNLRYVNKILENWQQEASRDGRDVNKKVTVTQTVLNKYYEYLRRKAEDDAVERKKQVYAQIPQIAEIDQMLNELGSSISRKLLAGDRNAVDQIRSQMEELEGDRAVLLTENNFNMDYTDVKYSCEICKDTGITEEGVRCSCTKKRIEEAEIWQKSI